MSSTNPIKRYLMAQSAIKIEPIQIIDDEAPTGAIFLPLNLGDRDDVELVDFLTIEKMIITDISFSPWMATDSRNMYFDLVNATFWSFGDLDDTYFNCACADELHFRNLGGVMLGNSYKEYAIKVMGQVAPAQPIQTERQPSVAGFMPHAPFLKF